MISLLPALPAQWKSGSVKGIKARGNFKVDIEWKEGKMTKSKIYSGSGGNCRIYCLQPVKVVETKATKASGGNSNPFYTGYGKPRYEKDVNAKLVEINQAKGYTIDFTTVKGKTYTVVPVKQ